MIDRNLYLNNISVEEAQRIYMKALEENLSLQYEAIFVKDSLHRVTHQAIYAKRCSPLFNASAMDGIGVVSANTKGATQKDPLTLWEGPDYVPVDTGDPITMPYDAVIMAEDVIEKPDGSVQILEAAAPWQHIRPIGEDIVSGEMILPGHHEIRPIDMAVLLSVGITEIEVVKAPKVSIYPTGTEIIEPEEMPKVGSIFESNSRMFAGMVEEAGGVALRFPPVADEYDLIKAAVLEGIKQSDIVIINAGSSAGREDYTVHVLAELGEVIVHGVACKPGKPVILAIVEGKPVIGLPGYPVSAYIGFENFVLPILSYVTDRSKQKNMQVEAVISRRLISSLKHREYVRVKVGRVENRLIASPLARGAGAAMSLAKADGFCIIEQNQEGVEAGTPVTVELYRPLEEVEHTLVMIGSHDLILDVLADIMPNIYRNMHVSSTHVGSMGGLMSINRGEAHIAPIHLLDEVTGEYNIPYLQRICQEPMALIKGVGRIQGIMVQKGNPKSIQVLEDLKDIAYINRQRGAGTRILLDYKLKEAGILTSEIQGYEREAITHMAVAVAIQSGSADAGLGILSAARALDLDFIEMCIEEYDFALPAKYLDLPEVQAFISILKSEEFKSQLDKLGGYRYENIGEVIQL